MYLSGNKLYRTIFKEESEISLKWWQHNLKGLGQNQKIRMEGCTLPDGSISKSALARSRFNV